MDEKLKKMLSGFEFNELLKLKKDLDAGAYLVKHLVNQKINEAEFSNRSLCASCNKKIDSDKEEIYTLLFGVNIKKKASFCGTDCLNCFIDELRKDKEYQIRKDMELFHN